MYKNLKYIFNNKLYINVFLIIKKKKKYVWITRKNRNNKCNIVI